MEVQATAQDVWLCVRIRHLTSMKLNTRAALQRIRILAVFVDCASGKRS